MTVIKHLDSVCQDRIAPGCKSSENNKLYSFNCTFANLHNKQPKDYDAQLAPTCVFTLTDFSG